MSWFLNKYPLMLPGWWLQSVLMSLFCLATKKRGVVARMLGTCLPIDRYTVTTILSNIAFKLYQETYGFMWLQMESWLRTHTAVRLQTLSLSLPLVLCISHITDATTIMWSVGCSLFLHLSIFFSRSSLSPSLSLTVCQDTGSCGQRELWEEEAEK